jgi:predicted CXXCH cytochrome family protein
MRRRALPLLCAALAAMLGAAPVTAQTQPTEDQCVGCHSTLEDARLRQPAEWYPSDVHAEVGFDCLACHGRPAEGAGTLDPVAGFLAAPARREIPGLCGRCHSDAAFMRDFNPSLRVDQVAEYRTSGHGRALFGSDDPDVATCVSCHPAHRIRPPTDPESSVYPLRVAELCAGCHADDSLMAGHDLPTDQLEEYRTSVHGRLMFEDEDLSAPTCNDCHGNHGAAPPGLASVRNVCGQCHAMMAEFFDGSGHEDVFEARQLPGCETCHGNHAVAETSDQLLVNRSETVCAACHSEGDPAGDEFRTMKALIDSLQRQEATSRAALLEAENLGMEVGDALFDLDEVSEALLKARTAIHAFQLEPVEKEIAAGLAVTEAGRARGEEALYEHWYRRAGLALSAGVILLLVLALILKIRQLESTPGPTTRPHSHGGPS